MKIQRNSRKNTSPHLQMEYYVQCILLPVKYTCTPIKTPVFINIYTIMFNRSMGYELSLGPVCTTNQMLAVKSCVCTLSKMEFTHGDRKTVIVKLSLLCTPTENCNCMCTLECGPTGRAHVKSTFVEVRSHSLTNTRTRELLGKR